MDSQQQKKGSMVIGRNGTAPGMAILKLYFLLSDKKIY
jgi:hypothetical protein